MELLRARVPKELLERIEQSKVNDHARAGEELAAFMDQDSKFHEVVKPLSEPGVSDCGKDFHSAMKQKTAGNTAFGSNNLEQAIQSYTMALKFMPFSSETFSDLAVLHVNRATSLHKAGLKIEGVRDCNRAISINESYSKAWYRRGLIKAEMLDFEGAMVDLQKALSLEHSESGQTHVEKEITNISQKLGTMKLHSGQQEASKDASSSSSSRMQSSQRLEPYWSSEKNWGLRTTSDLQPGSLLLVENASAAVLHKEYRKTHCHFCFDRLPPDSVPCNGCSFPSYCSEACRTNASAEHSIECGGTAWPGVLPVDALLASRILSSNSQVELCQLYDFLPGDRKVELHLIAVTLAKCLKDHYRDHSFGKLTTELVDLITKVRLNAMGVVHMSSGDKPGETKLSGIDHTTVAQALFTTGSKFNHSCNPNVFSSFVNRSLRVHAISFLPASTPVELSYGAQVGESPRSERREWLNEHYLFDCNCDSCSRGTLSDMLHSAFKCSDSGCRGIVFRSLDDFVMPENALSSEVKSFLVDSCDVPEESLKTGLRAGHCLKCGREVDVGKTAANGEKLMENLESLDLNDAHESKKNLLSDALKYAEQASKYFHEFNKQTARMEDMLAKRYCEAGELMHAIDHCKKSIKILEVLYGKDNVPVAYERLKLASIARAADAPEIAKACLEMVHTVFSTFYGADYVTVFPSLKGLAT